MAVAIVAPQDVSTVPSDIIPAASAFDPEYVTYPASVF